jgi:hypothetical protein
MLILFRGGARRTPDFLVIGVETERKTLRSGGANTLKNALQRAATQGKDIIIDARNVAISADDAVTQIERAEGNVKGLRGRVTVITSGGVVRY